jgi:hypothetical protein
MSLYENQAKPTKQTPGPIIFQLSPNCLSPSRKNSADRFLKRLPQKSIAGHAARNLEAAVLECSEVRQSDDPVMQSISSQQPIWQDVFIIERYGIRFCSTNKTAVAFHYVRHETVKAEEKDFAISVEHRTVVCHRPWHHLFANSHQYFIEVFGLSGRPYGIPCLPSRIQYLDNNSLKS